MGKRIVSQKGAGKADFNKKVYEATLVVTVFGVFFSLMLSKFSTEFLPSKAYSDVLPEIFLSFVAVGSFIVICLLLIFRYLHTLIYANKPKATGKNSDGFGWFLVRVIAVGGTPLGIFYGEVSILYLRFPAAFLYAYNVVVSLVYFGIWAVLYLLEEWHSRRQRK